jgi:prepilin-type N-terminal cleavage/methylation domain-containing protein
LKFENIFRKRDANSRSAPIKVELKLPSTWKISYFAYADDDLGIAVADKLLGELHTMKTLKNETGFTLIEIVVVIAIISIISAIAFVNYRHIVVKTHAAQIASNLHFIEDGIMMAIIDGRTKDDFRGRITAANFESSVLKPYVNHGNFTKVPRGITLSTVASGSAAKNAGPEDFAVLVWVVGEKGTERILEELEKMFPKTLNHIGQREFVVVDSSTLAVQPKTIGS